MAATSGVRSRSGRPVSTAKSRKVIERLQQKIDEGSFYEAHQTYRALFQRFCAQGNEEQALGLLLEGASTLLKHGQVSSCFSGVNGCGCYAAMWAWAKIRHQEMIFHYWKLTYRTETEKSPGPWVSNKDSMVLAIGSSNLTPYLVVPGPLTYGGEF